MLDESAWAGDDGDLFGSRLPSGNRVTTLVGLDGGPGPELVGRLAAAFEQYGGGDEAGLREGFYARVEDRLRATAAWACRRWRSWSGPWRKDEEAR